MDVKHRAWHIVAVPQNLAAFIVTMIVFSKPKMARAHCLFLSPNVCLDSVPAQCWAPGVRSY